MKITLRALLCECVRVTRRGESVFKSRCFLYVLMCDWCECVCACVYIIMHIKLKSATDMSLKPCGIINQPHMALQVNPFRVSFPVAFLGTSSDGKLYLPLIPLYVTHYAIICVDLVHVSPCWTWAKPECEENVIIDLTTQDTQLDHRLSDTLQNI